MTNRLSDEESLFRLQLSQFLFSGVQPEQEIVGREREEIHSFAAFGELRKAISR